MSNKSTRFKPGQSGNPKGRPKGSKDKFTKIRHELAELFEEQGIKEKLRGLVESGNKRDLITVLDRIIAVMPKQPLITNEQHTHYNVRFSGSPRGGDSLRATRGSEQDTSEQEAL